LFDSTDDNGNQLVSGDTAAQLQAIIDTLSGLKTAKNEVIVEADATEAESTIDALQQSLTNLTSSTWEVVISVTTKVKNAISDFFSGLTDTTTTNTGSTWGAISLHGNANAGGQWGAGEPSSTKLMGELGRELVVDPATNTWRTVGDNGTEFVRLPKNAIVFNHVQTEGILSNGRINTRGTAMVSGNAAASIVTGNVGEIHGANYKRKSSSDTIVIVESGDTTASTLSNYDDDIELLEYQIGLLEDMLNLYEKGTTDWFEQQQNIIDTYSAAIELTQAEYNQMLQDGVDVTSEEMRELTETLIGYQVDLYDASQEYWEAEKSNAEDTLNFVKEQAQAVVSLKESYHDLITSIESEQRSLTSQLQIAANAYPNLTEAEQEAIFSGEDYRELSNKLASILSEAQSMYTSYLQQIQDVGEDSEYQLEAITEEFERQYELKMDEYEVAKAELGVLKAQKALENVQNERNVAMLVGGLWTWVADSDAVKSAMEDLADAEQDLADAQSDATFNADIADWEGYISTIDEQLGAIDALVFSMDDLATEVHSLVDEIQESVLSAMSAASGTLISNLPTYTTTATTLFDTSSAQALWEAFYAGAVSSGAYTTQTSDIVSEILANMGAVTSNNQTIDSHTEYLVQIGDVVIEGTTAEEFINALRAALPLLDI